MDIAGCTRKVFLVCEFPSLAPPPLVPTRTWLGAYYELYPLASLKSFTNIGS